MSNKKLLLQDIKHDLLMIKINKSFYPQMSPRELYEYTRGYWKRNIDSVKSAEFALAVVFGEVVEAYRIDDWVEAANADNVIRQYDPVKYHDRIAFVGEVASEAIRDYYIGRDVSSLYKYGEANPVKLFHKYVSDKESMDINIPLRPKSSIDNANGIMIECPNCQVLFRKAQRCPECGQIIDYRSAKPKIQSLDEWVSKSQLRGVDAKLVADFVRSICQNEGFSYHIGTVDLNLDMRLKTTDKRVRIMMFCGGDNNRCEFQPKELYEYVERYGLSRTVVDEYFERMKKYLSAEQKNKPYERLNGYYSIDYSFLQGYLPSLRSEFTGLYESLNNATK